MANSEPVIERVVADNGRNESLWLLLCLAIILAFGSYGLSVNQREAVEVPGYQTLSVTEKATLTALRNAGDEIQFLADDLSSLPAVSELIDMALPPFSADTGQQGLYLWRKTPDNCYLGTPTKAGAVEFKLKLDTAVRVFWRTAAGNEHQHGDDKADVCVQDKDWQELVNE